jgi:hypothetical protein
MTIYSMVTNTMSKARIKGRGGPIPGLEAKGTESAEQILKSEHMNVCPDCRGPLRFGSRDPCEGDYYWCLVCGAGPVLFPLGTGPRPVPAIIDAEAEQRAAFIRQCAVVH